MCFLNVQKDEYDLLSDYVRIMQNESFLFHISSLFVLTL